MTQAGHTLPFRRDIQGLRAVAIALVVLAHAHVPGFAGGFVGVDVFFVLSGYLITGLLLRERLSTGTIRYGRFLSRRLRRLLPAMLVMLVVVLGLASALLSAYETRMQAGSFVYAATWTSNFFFALSEFDYFDALKGRDLFLHTWSLGVEEQFYVVWPWLLILTFLGAGNGALGRMKPLAWVLAAVFVVSLGLCLHWAEYGPLLGFYMMPARGWQFALGAAVFIWRRSPSPVTSLLLGAAGLILILGSAVTLHAELAYPGWYALLPSTGAALVIAAGHSNAQQAPSRLLASGTFVWLGDRSYSLYLWHWPVLLLGNAYGLTRSVAGVAALMAFSTVCAAISYRYIERPFWKGRYSRATPSRTVIVSAAVMIAAVGIGVGLKAKIYGSAQVVAGQGNYKPRLDRPAIYAPGSGCDTYYHSAELVPCSNDSGEAVHTAVLFGDSIGAQWLPLLEAVYTKPEWQVTTLTKSACAIVDEEYYYAVVGGHYDVCTQWREAALAYLEETRPDIVFIGSSSHYGFSEAQWTGGARRVIDRIGDAASRVVIIPGTPSLSFNGPGCLESPYRFSLRLADSRRECEEAQVDTSSIEVVAWLELAALGYDNVSVLNLNDLVCPGQRCAAQSADGQIVFRDNRHLTVSFIRSRVPEIRDRLDQLGVGPDFPRQHANVASSL